jgi:hypothetical protein
MHACPAPEIGWEGYTADLTIWLLSINVPMSKMFCLGGW